MALEGSPDTAESTSTTGTKEATSEKSATPEQRLEALKQKADQLHERIAGFLDNQFGSVDAARTYANNLILDPSSAASLTVFGLSPISERR